MENESKEEQSDVIATMSDEVGSPYISLPNGEQMIDNYTIFTFQAIRYPKLFFYSNVSY